jgi:hypothetical protein
VPDKTIARKLLLRPGQTLLLVNAPDGYEVTIGALPEGSRVVRQAAGPVEVIQVFIRSRADFDSLVPPLRSALAPKGILWVAYPKGGAKAGVDVNRNSIWARAREVSMDAVANFAVDDVWSALRIKLL